jgi:hypothetical protein
MAAQVGIGFKLPYTVGGFTDAAGNPTTVDATTPITRVAVSDATVADVVDVSGDSLAGAVRALAPGQCQLQVDVDVDRGGGVKTITLIGDVEVVAGEAVSGAITFGEAVPA